MDKRVERLLEPARIQPEIIETPDGETVTVVTVSHLSPKDGVIDIMKAYIETELLDRLTKYGMGEDEEIRAAIESALAMEGPSTDYGSHTYWIRKWVVKEECRLRAVLGSGDPDRSHMDETIQCILRDAAAGIRMRDRAYFLEGEPEVEVTVDSLRYLGEEGAAGSGTVRIGGGPTVKVDAESYGGWPRYRGEVPEGDEELQQETGFTHFDVWANILLGMYNAFEE